MRPNPAEKETMLRTLDRVIAIIGEDPQAWTHQHALNRARALIESIEPQRRCGECMHGSESYCLHWQCEIPTDWIEQGCDAWEEDIPF